MPTVHEQMLADIRDPLMIALVRRLTGPGEELRIAVLELASMKPLGLMLRFDADDQAFYFKVEKAADP